MIELTEAEKSSLDLGLKKNLLDSSKILGCELSEFQVIDFCKNPAHIDDYRVEFAWESDQNLRLRLAFKKGKPYLTQTLNGEEANIFVTWGEGLKPAFQFSGGVCQLAQDGVDRLKSQFSELPRLPSSEGSRRGIGLKFIEPLFIPDFAAAKPETPWSSMGLETRQPNKKYEVRDENSILRCRLIDDEWVVGFSTQIQPANSQVKLIISDGKKDLINETQELVYEDERWRFRYPLSRAIAAKVKNITVDAN
jgi:hypothetical protein